MLSWVLGKKHQAGKRKAPGYDKAKRIAETGSETERTQLAGFDDLEPEFLYLFASDKSADVRRAVAANDGTPLQADVILAEDADTAVREELAQKISKIIPTLTEQENERLTEMAMEVLQILAHDTEATVRAIISEEIKLLTNVPKGLVKQLARDAEDIVAMPILEYSPLLTTSELAQIIASGVQGGALQAIARRRGLADVVSGAIAETADEAAVTALLENETAQISEKTFEAINTAAEDIEAWHRPMVERANLSEATIGRIATFVSAALFERLISKNSLDAETEAELRLSVRQRIESRDLPDPDNPRQPADDRAKKLMKKGQLTDATLQQAIEDGDLALIPQALVILADVAIDKVKPILSSGSGKAVAGLVWKAGLEMQTAVMIQRRVAKVPPKNMLHGTDDGAYPLADDELEWHLASFL